MEQNGTNSNDALTCSEGNVGFMSEGFFRFDGTEHGNCGKMSSVLTVLKSIVVSFLLINLTSASG